MQVTTGEMRKCLSGRSRTKAPFKFHNAIEKKRVLEEHLENWGVSKPDLLGEPLLIIGRQVMIPDIGTRMMCSALTRRRNT
jgi:hypothetical protein